MIAALLAVVLAVGEPKYNLVPHSLKFGLVTVTDSIHYTWTMPESAQGGGVALHSWMTTELWFLPQFQPGFPPQAAPGSATGASLPVYGYGSIWPEVIGPGGRSPRGNCAPGKLQ